MVVAKKSASDIEADPLSKAWLLNSSRYDVVGGGAVHTGLLTMLQFSSIEY